MPRRKRDHLKRAIANAIGYSVDAACWIIMMHKQFEGVHEDYAVYLRLILQTQFQVRAMLEDFWKKSLGTDPASWEKYCTTRAAFYPKQLESVANRTKSGKGRLKKTFDTIEGELEDGTPAPLDRVDS